MTNKGQGGLARPLRMKRVRFRRMIQTDRLIYVRETAHELSISTGSVLDIAPQKIWPTRRRVLAGCRGYS